MLEELKRWLLPLPLAACSSFLLLLYEAKCSSVVPDLFLFRPLASVAGALGCIFTLEALYLRTRSITAAASPVIRLFSIWLSGSGLTGLKLLFLPPYSKMPAPSCKSPSPICTVSMMLMAGRLRGFGFLTEDQFIFSILGRVSLA